MQVLRLHHPAEAFAVNLCGYISSLVPSLKCRMDVQTSDGRGMVVRYVASYVSKWQDSYQNDSLYSKHVGPNQAAYKHLSCLKPLEPEMWLALTSMKPSWTSSRRKKLRLLQPQSMVEHRTHQKYTTRPAIHSHMSLLEWLRAFDGSKDTPTPYKDGCTLVGAKTASPLKDTFFFHHMLLHHPHMSLDALYHRDHDLLPAQIKNFASAYQHMHEFWSDSSKVASYFRNQGHKESFVETFGVSRSKSARLFAPMATTSHDGNRCGRANPRRYPPN